jgi:hypothetical protein
VAIIESQGAEKPRNQKTYSDPFSRVTSTIMGSSSTSRSFATAIRADQGEAEAYKAALLRGEIGIQRPTGANISGVDFITAVPMSAGSMQIREIILTDVKTTTVGAPAPKPKSVVPGKWQTELQDAVSPTRLRLGNMMLEQNIRQAALKPPRMRQLRVDYSPAASGSGRLSITGW